MGVDFEDRQDLLGHKNGSVTTLYSGAETLNLLDSAEKVVEWYSVKPKLSISAASHTRPSVGQNSQAVLVRTSASR